MKGRSDARSGLHDPPSIGNAIEPFGYHGGKRQRQIAAPARGIGRLFPLIDEGQDKIFYEKRNAVGCLDGALELFIRQALRARNGAGQFVTFIQTELAELDGVVSAGQVWAFWKRPARQTLPEPRDSARRFTSSCNSSADDGSIQ